ncbi:uncharacterized protein EV154DRAFT_430620 [Mucor mucedo]|uniref:uncharacterized protein n=1 Tax=Mucor mucedo TaxID=29922 RepID=UPI002220CE15|nr:uncharacterized protein EV154DRAFT_430620 [Mucor mucedo]KAI7873746.1 hypothetical protein EV154DRAFT_430620 [Mucor mucedo]
MYTTYLNRPTPPKLTSIANQDLNPNLTSMLLKIISNNDINEILGTIQEEKSKLSKAKQRHDDLYVMLSIIEKIIEDTEHWSNEQSEQEITFYRRFASLLDSLFNNCEIKMADGETGCESSKKHIEVNKRLFNTDDNSPSYPRKIDLLLKYDDRRNIELCSNEWKRAKHEDYFVASPYSTIVIPMKVSDISFLKSTLASLFSFKSFYTSLIPKLREKIMQHEISHDLDDVWIIEHDNQLQNNTNLIYFESKKRKSIDDNNDGHQSKRGSNRV